MVSLLLLLSLVCSSEHRLASSLHCTKQLHYPHAFLEILYTSLISFICYRHKFIIAKIINRINRIKRNYKLWEIIECAKTNLNTVTWWSDYRHGFGLEIGFTGHLCTQLITISNYSAIANLHTLQFTVTHARTRAHTHLCSQFATRPNSLFLVTAYNSVASSASALKSLPAGRRLTTEPSSKVKVKVTLRLAIYHQSVHLAAKPLETHDQRFFQLNLCWTKL
jgi:hypothetical protein